LQRYIFIHAVTHLIFYNYHKNCHTIKYSEKFTIVEPKRDFLRAPKREATQFPSPSAPSPPGL